MWFVGVGGWGGGGPWGRGAGGGLVTAAEVGVPAGPGDTWRLMAVCAQPRSGLLAEVLAALHEHAGMRSLAGAVSGVFNGTMVVFLLCRPAAPIEDPVVVGRQLEALTRPYRTVIRLLDGVAPPDAAPATARPLLRVQIRTPDRAGVMQDLLRELGRQVRARTRTATRAANGQRELPIVAGAPPGVDVLYALTPVVDGQALSGRLLVRLPHHPGGDGRWAGVDWPDLGRVVARAVARGPGPAGDAERTGRLSDDTVVTLDLVRRPVVPTT